MYTTGITGWTALTAKFDCSGADRGEALAPEAFAAAGLFNRLGIDSVLEVDARLTDTVRDPATGIIGYRRVVEIARNVYETTSRVLHDGSKPLLVGGDCGCIIGALAATRDVRDQLGAVFVDAHLDSWDGRTSTTGELADMDIAIVTGSGDPALVNLSAPGPICDPGHTIVIGYRVPDGAELQEAEPEHLLADPRIQVIRAEVVLRHDAAAVGSYAEERLAMQAGAFWLHFDVDCFDRRVMPAMTYGRDFGLRYEQLEPLLASLLASPALAGVSVCDFRPDVDSDGRHARRLVDLLAGVWPG